MELTSDVHLASLKKAVELHRLGRLTEAEVIYRDILRSQPEHFDALQLLAAIEVQRKNFLGSVSLFDKLLCKNPNHPGLLNNRGIALQELKRYDEALSSYDKAIEIQPGHVDAYNNRGSALHELKRYDDALSDYDTSVAINPGFAVAWYNRGSVLQQLKRYDEALASYDKAVALNAGYADAWNNRGNALQEMKRYDEALVSYDNAIALKPGNAEAMCNRGGALKAIKQFSAALANYERALAIKPDYAFLSGMIVHIRMTMCVWNGIDKQINAIREQIARHGKVTEPFPMLSVIDSPLLQKIAAELFVREKYPASVVLSPIVKHPRHEKIRIGYYSADFYDHPVSCLLAELFELHDRSRFEVIAFSFGPDKHDEMRRRVSAAFDRFIDVQNLSDRAVALLSRDLEIDIAIDLGGFTDGCRTGIFAMRAAPVQVSYIGYLGTMGAEYIDYLIADRVIVPEESRQYYTEKIVYLPSYQANDSKRIISDRVFTRKELGLPESGFVFCCFNNNYKITPLTFDGWMRILGKVEGSVLFLYADNDAAEANLKIEATARGIDSARLVFGKRIARPEYLARYRVADLFLDTRPYNAGTTASDALWAGLPVLTCMGESFASRVAASILNAIHLPELVTRSQEEYEARAIELASSHEKILHIKRKLEQNRLTTPLFDTKRFTENIEAAYIDMYDRYAE